MADPAGLADPADPTDSAGPAPADGGTARDGAAPRSARTRPPARALLPTATGPQVLAAVRGLIRPHRAAAIGGFAVLTAATTIGLLTAPLLGYIVDLAAARRASAVVAPAGWLAAAALTQGALTALGLGLIARAGEGALATLRERFVRRALALPLEQVEQAGSGDLTARVSGDVSVVAEAVRDAVPELARAVLTIGLTLIGLAVLDWRFLLVALLAAPIQVHTVRWYVRHAVPLYAAQRVAAGARQQQLLDTVGGAATVRALRLTGEHVRRVTRRSTAAVRLVLRGVRLLTGFYGRLNVAEWVGLSAVLVTGFLLVRGGQCSIGTATAAALYFHNLFGPINVALALVDDAQVASAGLARLVGVAERPERPEQPEAAPAAERPETPKRPAVPAGRREPAGSAAAVEIIGVGHAYVPGHPVLSAVDLTIAAGERVALVGASGAGKTTLARLVAGIHRPVSGSIRLAGRPPYGPGTAAPHRDVALVSQEVHVFAGTLADDLRLAGPDGTEDELFTALDLVGALRWARALPAGLDTTVGEGGYELTVTQAQQLALARLVLADPSVVILDEATAEAGSAGARVLEAAAARALEGRTALVVAHRLTQATSADRIVVLDAGRVVETGTHAELAAAAGPYATLWTAWSSLRPGR